MELVSLPGQMVKYQIRRRQKSPFERGFGFPRPPTLKCDRKFNVLVCLQGEWRWEDGSVFNYENFETVVPVDQYQCLQLNSQGRKNQLDR